MARETILIIEDERDLIEAVRFNLEREGFRVLSATDGEKGIDLAREKRPAVVLLDIMLPGVDGIEVARKLRGHPETAGVAIIMLTAKAEESDVVLGLGVGADDYMTKPFRIKELLARIKAVLRRSQPEEEIEDDRRIAIHDLEIDTGKHEVRLAGDVVQFTLTEFRLLTCLARSPGKVFSRDRLLERVHGDAYLDERNIDVHVRAIRKKLGDHADLVVTVRGVGYKFKD